MARKDLEKTRQYNREYKKSLRAKNPEMDRIVSREWRANNPEKYLCMRAKERANSKGLPFNIEPGCILIPTVCPILDIPLAFGGNPQTSPSIDRIIPELGYVVGNIQIISHKANTMKCNATPEELRKFAKWVLNAVRA